MTNPIIPSGTKITATLTLDQTASGSALLLIAHPSDSDSTGVAPAATGSVSITPQGFGILRIHVDMNEESDTGELAVEPGDVRRGVTGDDTEGFVVVEVDDQ
jgi:hypothetical protein